MQISGDFMKHALVLLFALLSMAVFADKIKNEDIGEVIFDSRRTDLIEAQQAEVEKKYKAAAKKYHKLAEKIGERDIQAAIFMREAFCWKRAGKVHDAYECYKNTIQQYPLYISYDEVVPQLRMIESWPQDYPLERLISLLVVTQKAVSLV